ncbi:unnamed protein product [Rotaria sp. Silwood2]|nr:unnamed protein product [Rotaria sp. Silwood2]
MMKLTSASQPDSNLPVTSPINIKNEESSNNHNDSFDSSQTIDVEPDQPEQKQKTINHQIKTRCLEILHHHIHW